MFVMFQELQTRISQTDIIIIFLNLYFEIKSTLSFQLVTSESTEPGAPRPVTVMGLVIGTQANAVETAKMDGRG